MIKKWDLCQVVSGVGYHMKFDEVEKFQVILYDISDSMIPYNISQKEIMLAEAT